MEQEQFDVIIIGAGAAGLMAAWELVLAGKKIALLEAKNRVGGRIHTIEDDSFPCPVELGAEFVHGNLDTTRLLMEKADLQWQKVKGDIWRREKTVLEQSDFIEDYSILKQKFNKLEHDLPVSLFLDQHLSDAKFQDLRQSICSYVEGYYAADPTCASTFALRDELSSGENEQFRIDGGYKKLIGYLQSQLRQKECSLFLSAPVQEVHWAENKVVVMIPEDRLQAKKLLVTTSLGVLQQEKIWFAPALRAKAAAAKALGFGAVIKLILLFKDAFWKNSEYTDGKNLDKLGFLFSNESVPTWWTQYPAEQPMLTGWIGGPNAEILKDLTDEELLQQGLNTLVKNFTIAEQVLRSKLKSSHVYNWSKDPCFLGGYSYEVVNGDIYKKTLSEPEANTIFFAGEALHDGIDTGTVEAALVNGRETAHRLIASF